MHRHKRKKQVDKHSTRQEARGNPFVSDLNNSCYIGHLSVASRARSLAIFRSFYSGDKSTEMQKVYY